MRISWHLAARFRNEIRYVFHDSSPQMVIYKAVCRHIFENQLYSIFYHVARLWEWSDTPTIWHCKRNYEDVLHVTEQFWQAACILVA